MKIVRIFRAGIADVEDLKKVEIACELSPWTLEGYVSEMKRDDVAALIARREDSEAVGFVIGRIPRADGAAEIFNIGVIEDARRHGIANALLTEFVEVSRNRGVSEVWLETRVSNEAGINFYRANDFEVSGIRRSFYDNPTEDAQLMTLKLLSDPDQQKIKGA